MAKYNSNGYLYGGRLGYIWEGVLIGLEYARRSYDIDSSGKKYYYKGEYKSIGVGYFFKFPLRIGACLIYDVNIYANHHKTGEGVGTSLYISYLPFTYLALNLEYKETRINDGYFAGHNLDDRQLVSSYSKMTEFFFIISFPIRF